ncbi:MAG: hypothetical protein PHY08_07660 [Candidatus Cloacimonetes bacterium]|nr:hypothetical protein [Candidatus Cloacimonadota bacterium]
MKKLRLLCDSNQMAYGSSSALLAILDHIDSENTAFAWGITKEILSTDHKIHNIISIDNKNPNAVKEAVDLNCFDAVIVVSNLSNIEFYVNGGLPIFFIDLHHWYPTNKNHVVWESASKCFVENFLSNNLSIPDNVCKVGPVIRLTPNSNSKEKIVLVNFGGAENRWIVPGLNSDYIKWAYKILEHFFDRFSDYLIYIAAGYKAIATLTDFDLPKNVKFRTFTQAHYLDILSKSEYLITSPGLNAVFEGMYYGSKTIFLPPQNTSQIIQLSYYENSGLVSKGLNLSDFFDYLNFETELNFNEQDFTKKVLLALNDAVNDSVIYKKIIGHLSEQLNYVNNSNYPELIKSLTCKLGFPGSKTIASYISSAMGDKSDFLADSFFRSSVIKRFNIDPFSLAELKKLVFCSLNEKTVFNSMFTSLLHSAETLLLENFYNLDNHTREIQFFIDDLCKHYESLNPNRDFTIRIAFTTTNLRNAVSNLISSAIKELNISYFNHQKSNPIIEFLVIENSSIVEICECNRDYCKGFRNKNVAIRYVDWDQKSAIRYNSFSIAQSRTFLINEIHALGWQASQSSPIWILDDDFEFIVTVPNKEGFVESVRFGSIFHRLECLSSFDKVDAIIGGNSGASPLPELSTIRLQLMDLNLFLKNQYPKLDFIETLNSIKLNSDYFYDLSRVKGDYFPVIPMSFSKVPDVDFLNEFFVNLLSGKPASRFLFPPLNSNDDYVSAWKLNDGIAVSGGNTIYFNDDLLSLNNYWSLEYNNAFSRRADAIWFLVSRFEGYNIGKMNFPLNHSRSSRISADIFAADLLNNSIKDILGVALWEATNSNKYMCFSQIELSTVIKFIKEREAIFEKNRIDGLNLLKDIEAIIGACRDLDSFMLLKEIFSEPISIDYNKLKLVNYGC